MTHYFFLQAQRFNTADSSYDEGVSGLMVSNAENGINKRSSDSDSLCLFFTGKGIDFISSFISCGSNSRIMWLSCLGWQPVQKKNSEFKTIERATENHPTILQKKNQP